MVRYRYLCNETVLENYAFFKFTCIIHTPSTGPLFLVIIVCIFMVCDVNVRLIAASFRADGIDSLIITLIVWTKVLQV